MPQKIILWSLCTSFVPLHVFCSLIHFLFAHTFFVRLHIFCSLAHFLFVCTFFVLLNNFFYHMEHFLLMFPTTRRRTAKLILGPLSVACGQQQSFFYDLWALLAFKNVSYLLYRINFFLHFKYLWSISTGKCKFSTHVNCKLSLIFFDPVEINITLQIQPTGCPTNLPNKPSGA